MSTKVYRAHKMKDATKLWDVVCDVKKRGVENVRTALRQIYASTIEVVDPESEEYKNLRKDLDDWSARHRIAHNILRDGYRKQLGSFQRDLYDFDVNIGIWEHEGSLYLRPFCDMLMKHVLDFMQEDERLVDFAFWDNADQPDEISNEEWKARGAIWDAIDEKRSEHLVLEICSWSNYMYIDPWMDDTMAHAKEKRETR